MTGIIVQGLYLLISTLCIAAVGEWTFHWIVKDKKKYLYASVIYGLVLIVCSLPGTDMWSVPLYYIAQIAILSYLCASGSKNKIIKIISLTFIVGTVEELIRFLLSLCIQRQLGETEKLLVIFLTFGAFAYICNRKSYQKFAEAFERLSGRKHLLLLLLSFLSMAIATFGQELTRKLDNDRILAAFQIFVIVDLLVVAGVVIWFTHENARNKYFEEMFRMDQEYFCILQEKDREMRSFRHDIAGHMGILQMMIEQNNVEKAKDYIKSMRGDFEKTNLQKIHVGDESVDALLTTMGQKARENGIRIDVKGSLGTLMERDPYELCVIFSNAIQNALEACLLVGGEQEITVKILNYQNTLYLTFTNPATEEMYQSIRAERTSKEDSINHGFGVHKIKTAVKRLGGSLRYTYENEKITLDICL